MVWHQFNTSHVAGQCDGGRNHSNVEETAADAEGIVVGAAAEDSAI